MARQKKIQREITAETKAELDIIAISDIEASEEEACTLTKSTLPSLPKGDYQGLYAYIQKVNSFKMLTQQEEQDLCDKFYNQGDALAGNTIFLSHLRLVVKIAFGFKKHFDNMQELIAEGNVGLLKALKKFDTKKNVRFATYAMLWIRASVQDFINKNKSIIAIGTSTASKNVIYNLPKVLQNNDGSFSSISSSLGAKNVEAVFGTMSPIEVEQIYSNAKYGVVAIDENFEGAGHHVSSPYNSSISTPEEDYQERKSKQLLSAKIQKALDTLDDRSKTVIQHRFLSDEKSTLSDVAKLLGVSIERVRQIEVSAITKMKTILGS